MLAAVEAHNRFAGQGAVLLDIGGDVGALVVTMPPELVGQEVEIRPADGSPAHSHSHSHSHADGHHHHHPHVAVVARPTADGPVPSLVYPDVTAGEYELVVIGAETTRRRVRVEGGTVTTTTWV